MSKKLTIGSDSFDYPVTGSSNYGEEATGWAEAVTDAVSEIRGPGDISTTTKELIGLSAPIPELLFDTAFVQRIEVTGILIREFTEGSGKSRQVESFSVEGAFNGVEFNITQEFSGDDTQVSFSMIGGQFQFTSENVPDTASLRIKFKGKAIVDENVI